MRQPEVGFMDERNPNQIFGFIFTVSSVAGLAAFLRSNQPVTIRNICSAFLNSGLFGLGVAAVWWEYYGGSTHPWFMIGVSTLAGLGGTSMVDFGLQICQEAFRTYAIRAASEFPVRRSDPNQPATPETKQ
jgi:hypothetical protein